MIFAPGSFAITSAAVAGGGFTAIQSLALTSASADLVVGVIEPAGGAASLSLSGQNGAANIGVAPAATPGAISLLSGGGFFFSGVVEVVDFEPVSITLTNINDAISAESSAPSSLLGGAIGVTIANPEDSPFILV